MKIIQTVNRGALGTVLTQGPDRATRQLKTDSLSSFSFELAEQQVALVWPSEASIADLPELIIVNEGMARDFLAWSNTFLTQFKPLTSHLRVIERGELVLYEHAVKTPEPQTRTESVLRQAGIGLMLGELLSSGFLARSFRQSPLPVNTLAGGLVFPALRALWIGTEVGIDVVAARWSYLRQVTRQQERPLSPRIVAALRVLGEITGQGKVRTPEEKKILEICREASRSNWRANATLDEIPEVRDVLLEEDDTREVRVTKFETAVRRLSSKSTSNAEMDSFVVGLLANLLDPGRLTYVDLIYPLLPKWPSALIWYGLCAGLAEKSYVLYEFGGVGLRAWREVSRPESIFSRPSADLSLLELDVLLSADRPSEEFVTTSGSSLTVELLPNIWSIVPWGNRSRRADTASSETSAARDEWRVQADEQINVLLARVSELVAQLSGRSHPRTGSSQRELFSGTDPSKRKRTRR